MSSGLAPRWAEGLGFRVLGRGILGVGVLISGLMGQEVKIYMLFLFFVFEFASIGPLTPTEVLRLHISGSMLVEK